MPCSVGSAVCFFLFGPDDGSGHGRIEKKKKNPGVHTSGLAVDIGASHEKAYIILKLAMQRNLPGIGINQKGNGRFIHLDISEPEENRPRPHLWSY